MVNLVCNKTQPQYYIFISCSICLYLVNRPGKAIQLIIQKFSCSHSINYNACHFWITFRTHARLDTIYSLHLFRACMHIPWRLLLLSPQSYQASWNISLLVHMVNNIASCETEFEGYRSSHNSMYFDSLHCQ